MELWSSLFNHHLHRGLEPAFADPAGCSSYGARHATCKIKAPRERSTQTTPSRNLTLGVMQLVTLRSPEPVGRHHPRLRGLLGGLIRGLLGSLRRSTVAPIGAENLGADTLPGRGAPRYMVPVKQWVPWAQLSMSKHVRIGTGWGRGRPGRSP